MTELNNEIIEGKIARPLVALLLRVEHLEVFTTRVFWMGYNETIEKIIDLKKYLGIK